jgi:hypothetical protein
MQKHAFACSPSSDQRLRSKIRLHCEQYAFNNIPERLCEVTDNANELPIHHSVDSESTTQIEAGLKQKEKYINP